MDPNDKRLNGLQGRERAIAESLIYLELDDVPVNVQFDFLRECERYPNDAPDFIRHQVTQTHHKLAEFLAAGPQDVESIGQVNVLPDHDRR